MPYIPEEIETRLKQLEKDLRFAMTEKKERQEASLEHILNKLKGRPQSQLSAVNALADRNLRAIAPEIRDWLGKDPLPEAAAMMIDLLAEQEVAEEFTFTRNGVEYTFYGDAVTPVVKSEGYQKAYRMLGEWFSKEPSLYELARTVLISKCYMALPVSYEKEEADALALECAHEVTEAMGMQDLYEKIQAERNS